MADQPGFKALVTDAVKLISLPDIYLRVRVVLNNEDSSAEDLAEIMRADPGLTARLLKLANSPFYGFRARVETISRAIALLGSRQVHDIVLATSVARTFQNLDSTVMNVADFWRSSVYCALVSRLLAKQCNVLDSERLFVHGLLRDVGHLLMYQKIPEQAERALTLAAEQSRLLVDVEQEVMGFDFTQVGHELMRVWDMPEALQASVRWHQAPDSAPDFFLEASIVHIAALLTTVMDSDDEADFYTLAFSPEALKITRLSEECLQKLQLEGRSYLEDACSLLLPQNAAPEKPAKRS